MQILNGQKLCGEKSRDKTPISSSLSSFPCPERANKSKMIWLAGFTLADLADRDGGVLLLAHHWRPAAYFAALRHSRTALLPQDHPLSRGGQAVQEEGAHPRHHFGHRCVYFSIILFGPLKLQNMQSDKKYLSFGSFF